MTMKKEFLFIILFVSTINVFATKHSLFEKINQHYKIKDSEKMGVQKDKEEVRFVDRKEIDISEKGFEHTTPCGENGIIMHGKIKKGTNEYLRFTRFDNSFNQQTEFEIKLKNRVSYSSYYLSPDQSTLYLIFLSTFKKSLIVKYEIKYGNFEYKYFTFSKGLRQLNNFYVLDNIVYIGVMQKKSPAIMKINFDSEKKATMFFPFMKTQLMLEMNILGNGKGLLVSYYNSKKKLGGLQVSVFDTDGYEETSFAINLENKKYAVGAMATKLNDGSFILTGGYSESKSSDFAVGSYMLKYSEKQGVEFDKYYKFNAQSNTVSKSDKKSKDNMGKYSTRLISHPVRIINGEYVILSEFFYEVWEQRTTYTTDANGRTSARTTYVFIGLQYTTALMSGLDAKGNIIWQQEFDIRNMARERYPRKVLKWFEDSEAIKLVFAKGNYLSTYSMSNGEEFKSVSYKISNDEKERVTRSNATCEYWYGDYFLIHGYQEIKGSKKRKVYFVEKITYKK
jgi:hypothetical protein